jgi:3-oxoacyl-[acyl-carrier protein] reductase
LNLNLKNKVAVVLASSRGIGLEIAYALAEEGCSIAICARRGNDLELAAKKIREKYNVSVITKTVDLSIHKQIDDFFDFVYEKYQTIDILINNSGGPKVGSCLTLSDDDFYQAFSLILMSKIRAIKRVVPKMLLQGSGRIINIESTGIKNTMANMALSNIFRSGSNAFIKTLAMETIRSGIRVHTIMLGPFLTDRLKELGSQAAKNSKIDFETWKIKAADATPLGRFGLASEIGPIVAFLASEKSNYMNGLCFAVDGGILQSIN